MQECVYFATYIKTIKYNNMTAFSEGEDGEIFIKNVYRLANQMLFKEPLQREMYHFLFD